MAARTRTRRAVVVAVTLAVTVVALAWVSPAGAAEEAAESQFVSLTNGARSGAGLRGLGVDGELLGIARRWSAHMAANNQLAHNPNLSREVTQDWAKLGENVGVGDNPQQIHDAFMNSPAHRANILDGAFTRVGIGVARGGDGRMWVTEVFMRLRSDDSGGGGGTPPPTTAAPAPRPTAAPTTARPRPPRPTPTTAPPPPPPPPTTTSTSTTTTTAPPPPTVQPAPALAADPSPRVVLVLSRLVALDRGR
jgi:uncharacterized protein YkwD